MYAPKICILFDNVSFPKAVLNHHRHFVVILSIFYTTSLSTSLPLPSLFLCLAPVAPPLLSIELPLYVVAMLN